MRAFVLGLSWYIILYPLIKSSPFDIKSEWEICCELTIPAHQQNIGQSLSVGFQTITHLPCGILVSTGEDVTSSLSHAALHIRHNKVQPPLRLVQWEFNIHLQHLHLWKKTIEQTKSKTSLHCSLWNQDSSGPARFMTA